MDYDFRNRTGSGIYGPPGAAPAASMYPRVGQSAPPPVGRGPPFLHPGSSPAVPSPGLGIKVLIKPEYCISPPPLLAPTTPELPRSTFKFDFEFEKKILAEAEKESPNWSRFTSENQSSTTTASTSSLASSGDPIIDKYVAQGLGAEAVSFAVTNYGDNSVKVREFVKSFNLLKDMGFSSKDAAEKLAMYDNDTDKALAHLLSS